MAPLRRHGRDAVALGAAGIVLGTTFAALGAPLLLALALAAGSLLLRLRIGAILAGALVAAFLLAPHRGAAAGSGPLRGRP